MLTLLVKGQVLLRFYSRDESIPFCGVMRKKILFTIVLILITIFIAQYILSYWNSLPAASYNVGDEVKGFPVSELSLTIWNYYIVQEVPELFSGGQFLILNVSIHNLVDRDLLFNDSIDFHSQLVEATNKYLVLQYSRKVGQVSDMGLTNPKIPSGQFDWWGIALNVSSLNSLGPNQSINGSMYFTTGQDFTPEKLICKSSTQTKPLFEVNLTH
jgi:hypothetical protein